jgi:YVTN family beta-propeller protein
VTVDTDRFQTLALALSLASALSAGDARADAAVPAAGTGRVVRDGVVVDFSILPSDAGRTSTLVEGEYANVRFRMSDAASGRPVPGLKPAAWMDMSGVVGGKAGEQRACKDKVALYLQGSVGIRPMVDLNSYYLLVLNQDASVSVIDPVVSMTGSTSLFATVVLKRPAADWTKSLDQKRLYLSLPRAGEVTVVDAETFKVVAGIPAGAEPMRLALQPDGRRLWVGDDAKEPGKGGVTVIDTETSSVVATIPTGSGHHEIALAGDRVAFVTNRESGTVTAIDAQTLERLKDLATGPLPIAVAYSPLSASIYVADGKSGVIAVIDPSRVEIVARIETKPGLGPLRFTQDGRWGFAVNPTARTVFVVDATENRLVHAIPLDGQPYQVSFTRAFAYVRLLDSDQVKMVNLLSLGADRKPTVQGFGAGTGTPKQAGDLSAADSVAQAATEAAVFVVNPADSNTYFYMEGMNAPMGSFGGYGHAARAVAVVDRSLKEVEPGVYSGKVRIPVAGQYDVAFLLDNPRILHCFSAEAQENPVLRKDGRAMTAEFLDLPLRAVQGVPLVVRVKLLDVSTRAARAGLRDVRVLHHASSGGPRGEVAATEVGDGVYEARFVPEQAGVHYLLLSVPSQKARPNELPFRGILVESPPTQASHTAGPS